MLNSRTLPFKCHDLLFVVNYLTNGRVLGFARSDCLVPIELIIQGGTGLFTLRDFLFYSFLIGYILPTGYFCQALTFKLH